MPNTEASGTQTATVGTEHTLNAAAFTAAGLYVLTLDTSAMAEGATPDILEVRVYEKVLTGSTKQIVIVSTLVGKQVEPVKTFALDSMFYAEFTLKQTQGTGRAYEWRVVTV
jgi:hypothetical protein